MSGNYFDVLGIRAQLGRTFAPDEDTAPGAHPVVVLSDALWTDQFGADPGVIGTRVAINGQPFTIIGVAQRGFTGAAFATDPYLLWMPMAMQGAAMPRAAGLLTDANQTWLRVVGRLRDGVTAVRSGCGGARHCASGQFAADERGRRRRARVCCRCAAA